MKLYHLRHREYNNDYVYIPEYNTFIGYLQEHNVNRLVDYSNPDHVKRIQALIDGNPDKGMNLKRIAEIEIDKKTALKIAHNKSIFVMSFRKTKGFDGSTKSLVKILTGK